MGEGAQDQAVVSISFWAGFWVRVQLDYRMGCYDTGWKRRRALSGTEARSRLGTIEWTTKFARRLGGPRSSDTRRAEGATISAGLQRVFGAMIGGWVGSNQCSGAPRAGCGLWIQGRSAVLARVYYRL